MGRRNITTSDEAYRELVRLKGKGESFTDVVLRLASWRGNAKALRGFLEGFSSTEDLAKSIEKTMKRTRNAPLTRVASS